MDSSDQAAPSSLGTARVDIGFDDTIETKAFQPTTATKQAVLRDLARVNTRRMATLREGVPVSALTSGVDGTPVGCGYNAYQAYASSEALAAPVLDFDRLTDDGLVSTTSINDNVLFVVSGESLQEVSENTRATVGASGGADLPLGSFPRDSSPASNRIRCFDTNIRTQRCFSCIEIIDSRSSARPRLCVKTTSRK
ncbi:MAG: hypothetical protein AAFN74_26655 [Myxococcota bacterium]